MRPECSPVLSAKKGREERTKQKSPQQEHFRDVMEDWIDTALKEILEACAQYVSILREEYVRDG